MLLSDWLQNIRSYLNSVYTPMTYERTSVERFVLSIFFIILKEYDSMGDKLYISQFLYQISHAENYANIKLYCFQKISVRFRVILVIKK